ncbi:heterokaryon incompatibility protein-domain-containing protein [Paraphoma chrysanthemicola]|nr:heterokaryon incompatibility protein-domain-containing protein [Paraphoma chrysanthemicola]
MGCHLCSLLACPDPHAKSNPPSDCENIYMVGVYQQQSYDGPGRIEMQVMQYQRKIISLFYDSPKAKLQGSLRYRRTDTEQIFSLARKWLNQCQSCHSECQNVSRDKSFVPTRLLDISTGLEGTVTSIRLCVTSNMSDKEKKVEYLALSHCWGGVATTTLKMSTLAAFQTSIALSSLPQNFMDAAIIAVKLGFRYLWIDSLCIIQDSPLDKAREIPTMGSVYGCAAITIAALGAKNSYGGCFSTRNPLSLVPALLRDGDSTTRDQVWAGSQQLQDPSAQGPLRPPLHKRGWVVQERALAPRTLSFGTDMVYWDCLGGVASEAVTEIKKESGDGLKIALMQCSAEKGKRWQDWESFWWNIVHEYSISKLTHPSDKWNAFSALAMRAEVATEQTLYHGLWERNFFEESLWKCDQPGRRINPTDLDVPTWTWLSVDAPVNNNQRFNYERDFDKVATVTDPPLTRFAADGLGRSTTLIIQGHLMNFSWSSFRTQNGESKYNFRFTDHPELHNRSKCDWFPDVVPQGDWKLSAIPMVVNKKGGIEAYGLVVKPNDESNISWARVGLWQIFGHEVDEADILGSADKDETITLV